MPKIKIARPPKAFATALLASGANQLSQALSFSRTSGATGIVNGKLTEFAANAPRWVDALSGGFGLLIEGQRTNSIRNPRLEGAAAGTPGTDATGWLSFGNVVTGITRQIVGVGTESNIPYVDIRYSGTAISTFDSNFWDVPTTTVSAVSGQATTHSCYLNVQAGSLTNVTTRHVILGLDAIGTQLEASDLFFVAPIGGNLTASKATGTRTLNNALTTNSVGYLSIRFTIGLAVDVTFRFGGPQFEFGSTPSSLILPPVGTRAASTRFADTLLTTNISQLIPNKNNWAILVDWTPTTLAENDAFPSTFTIANPSYAFRFSAYTALGTRIRNFDPAGGTGGITLGTYTDGVRRREMAGVSGGFLRGSTNGAAITSAAYTLDTSGLDRLLIGQISPGGSTLNAIIRQVVLYSTCPPDPQFQIASQIP